MSYTFGGATGHDLTFTCASNIGGDAQASLMAGWFYPTTLTSGRFYWSCGNVFGASINSTTDQLLMFSDNTTDGQWTADPNIVVNTWRFIAWLFTGTNTGPAGAWRVWAGDILEPPVEYAVTQTVAPVGNFTGSSSRTVGNRGTGTVGFQGQIGWMSFLSTGNTSSSLPFGISAPGAITNDEAALVYNRWVYPLWAGRPVIHNTTAVNTTGTNYTFAHVPLTQSIAVEYSHDPGASAPIKEPTVNGASFSSNFPPVMPHEYYVLRGPGVTRPRGRI